MRIPRSYIREWFVRGAGTFKGPPIGRFLFCELILGPVTHPIVYGAWEKGARHRRLGRGGLFPCGFSDSRWDRVQQLACEAPRILEPERDQGYLRWKPAQTN